MKTLKLMIWIGFLSGGILLWQYNSYTSQTLTFTDPLYEVSSGDTFAKILEKETGSNILTRLYLKSDPPSFLLQKGSYAINGQYNITEFLEALKTPLPPTYLQVVILEGWNIYDIDICLSNPGSQSYVDNISGEQKGCIYKVENNKKVVHETPLIEKGGFVAHATTGDFTQYHFVEGFNSLEGYLYPDTYNINPNGFSIEQLVSQMLSNFNTKVYQPLFTHADNETIFELITLASIVQKEASFGDDATEIATIAGILKKRLNEGWQIGADATVCYAHKIATQNCTPTEVIQYLYDENGYNTRAIAGLPAGPIANPEIQVIEATLKSIDSPYYFYLHDDSGKIHYGKNNAEHIENKNKYLR